MILKYIFLSETQILLTNDKDVNILQDRSTYTNELFKSREDALEWAKKFADETGATLFHPIGALRESKKEEISIKCGQVIYGGFQSDAYQGIVKTYSTADVDQGNIRGLFLAVLSKKAGTPDCENDRFYWHAINEDFVEFTEDEITKLARDMMVFLQMNLFKSKAIQKFIDTLETEDEINAVTWDIKLPEPS
jgi:hypothetical protein